MMRKNRLLGAMIVALALIFGSCSKEENRVVLIETDFGDMKVRLFNSTPKHRDNFIKLVEEGYYDGTLFHRIIQNFMIQGGDPDSRNAAPGQPLGTGGPGYTVDAEIGAIHTKGALAAARQDDSINPEKKSSGSQFYIVQGMVQGDGQLDAIERQKGIKYSPDQRQLYKTIGGTPQLDMDYTVFGEVIEGMEVIDKIAAQPSAMMNRPVDDIEMTIKIIK